MPNRRFSSFVKGFVDPLSLVMVGFLVLTIAVGTYITNNRDIILNLSDKAASSTSTEYSFCSDATNAQCGSKCAPSLSGGTCPVTNCVGEGGYVANGTGPCCSGLAKVDCVSAGSFSNCKCGKPVASTPTPLTKECTARNCSGGSCKATVAVVSYSQVCSSSNCVNDTDCSANTSGQKTIGEKCGGNDECQSGNCYAGNAVMGGSPFDSKKACHAQSITTMDNIQQDVNTGVAVGGTAILTTALAAPVLADAALYGYAYGSAALTTAPAWVQTSLAITGTVAGYAGVTAGTVACAKNPYSDACISYIAAIQGDPMALIQLANSADDLINLAKQARSNPLAGMTFNIEDQQIKMPSYNTESEAVQITKISPTKIIIQNGDQQLLSVDLEDPLLRQQVKNAINAVSNLPSEEQSLALYDYSSQFMTKDLEQYSEIMSQAAKTGTPVSLSQSISENNAVCFERHCFLNIVNNAMDKQRVLDYFISSNPDAAGHVTNSLITKDPLARLADFKDTLLFDTSNIGLIQRVNLFVPAMNP